MSGWVIGKGSSLYGPFATKSAAVIWAEKKFGAYVGGGWFVSELWNPKNVDG